MNKIRFTHRYDNNYLYPPKPAYECIPDWYKNTLGYVTKKPSVEYATSTGTIKKCIPVFDALTAGYILFTPCDVWVRPGIDGVPEYQWSSSPNKIAIHPIEQADKYPSDTHNNTPFPKWINDWIITTPSGYSCMFISPMHNPNPWFDIAPGIVDTDTYRSCVHFPFTLKNTQGEYLIPAGTPMVQVIPFKRTSWKMVFGNKKDIEIMEKTDKKLFSQFFNRYKTMFWHRKEFK